MLLVRGKVSDYLFEEHFVRKCIDKSLFLVLKSVALSHATLLKYMALYVLTHRFLRRQLEVEREVWGRVEARLREERDSLLSDFQNKLSLLQV